MHIWQIRRDDEESWRCDARPGAKIGAAASTVFSLCNVEACFQTCFENNRKRSTMRVMMCHATTKHAGLKPNPRSHQCLKPSCSQYCCSSWARFFSPLIQTTRRKPRGAAGNEIQLEQRMTDLQEMVGVLSDPATVRNKKCVMRTVRS